VYLTVYLYREGRLYIYILSPLPVKPRHVYTVCTPQGGVGAAHIHIALAAPREVLVHDSDCCGCIYWLEDFITTPLRIEGGFAYPPQGLVGLGVELDREAVERWSKPGG
jgi:L-alanine-DL-glutamate epimerase-like enolase superfamily enzyme